MHKHIEEKKRFSGLFLSEYGHTVCSIKILTVKKVCGSLEPKALYR
jgi:hypothetical protein